MYSDHIIFTIVQSIIFIENFVFKSDKYELNLSDILGMTTSFLSVVFITYSQYMYRIENWYYLEDKDKINFK